MQCGRQLRCEVYLPWSNRVGPLSLGVINDSPQCPGDLSSNQDKKIEILLLSLGIKNKNGNVIFRKYLKILEVYFKNIHHILYRCSDF